MRILFFIDRLIAGGKERRLTELMKELKINSEIIFELAVMAEEVHYQEIFSLGIKIHYIIRKSKNDLSVFTRFYKVCNNFNPDIVHCWDGMTTIYALPTCKLLKVKIVNGLIVDSPAKKAIFNKYWLRNRLTFRFSDIIVGNSLAGIKAYGAPKDKSFCIYNGIDLSRFSKIKDTNEICKEVLPEHNSDYFIVGMVAAFEDRKDYRTLVNSALSLVNKRSNIRFVLVGEGKNFENIKAMVDPSLRNQIIFLGKRSDVDSIIKIFDVGVLLTNSEVHGEGISNSIIEYMALSKPVIATRGGGTNEVVYDNQNGFLIDPGNADQLTEKICLLMNDTRLGIYLGQKGREIIEAKFDIKIMTPKFIKLYNGLVG